MLEQLIDSLETADMAEAIVSFATNAAGALAFLIVSWVVADWVRRIVRRRSNDLLSCSVLFQLQHLCHSELPSGSVIVQPPSSHPTLAERARPDCTKRLCTTIASSRLRPRG